MAKAIAKFVRMSPRKLRRVVNVIRGRSAKEARSILKLMPYAASRVVEKILDSAVANAKNNENLNPDELKITRAFVDQSVTLRRWRAMSRGRGYPILKRTSHITVEVNPELGLGKAPQTQRTKGKEKRIEAKEIKQPRQKKEVEKGEKKEKSKETKDSKPKKGKTNQRDKK